MLNDSSNPELGPQSEESVGHKRPHRTWGPLAGILLTIVVYVVAQFLAGLVLLIYPTLRHWNHAQADQWLTGSVIAQFGYSVFVEGLSIFAVWEFLRRKGTSLKAIGLTTPKVRDITYVVGGFVIYFIITIIATGILKHFIHGLDLNQQQAVGFQSATGSQLLLTFTALVVLPPLAEEILFRGFLYSGLRRALPVFWAALATSILFALPHLLEGTSGGLLWAAGIDTFILSLVLVYLREKTGSLWASIGLHALKNGIAFFTLFVLHAG